MDPGRAVLAQNDGMCILVILAEAQRIGKNLRIPRKRREKTVKQVGEMMGTAFICAGCIPKRHR